VDGLRAQLFADLELDPSVADLGVAPGTAVLDEQVRVGGAGPGDGAFVEGRQQRGVMRRRFLGLQPAGPSARRSVLGLGHGCPFRADLQGPVLAHVRTPVADVERGCLADAQPDAAQQATRTVVTRRTFTRRQTDDRGSVAVLFTFIVLAAFLWPIALFG
jgi:hypothetical protein